MATQEKTTPNNTLAPVGANAPVAQEANATATAAQNFTKRIEKQFAGELGQSVQWSPVQQRLAQHLFIKIDGQLRALETKRAGNRKKQDEPPIAWANVNMHKLTLDAVHRVNLGLDALIANHIHVIPYLNTRTRLYDVDLQIGYTGLDHCHRTFARENPIDVTYQLVYEGDHFSIDRSAGWEQPLYEPKDYFNPGNVIGGFGYIQYEEPRKNRVIVVPYREFEKAMKASKGVEFWGGVQKEWKDGKLVEGEFDEKFFNEMCYKTVVKRVVAKIPLDPEKVNAVSWNAISEAQLDVIEGELKDAIEENANQGGQLALSAPDASSQIQAATPVAEKVPAAVGGVEEGPGY